MNIDILGSNKDLLDLQLYRCYAHALQADMAGDDSEAARAQSALSQRKSLRPSLSRSPTMNKSSAATEKPGAAMVSTS